MNCSDNTPNQSIKFRTKTWVEINDDARGMYINNSQIKLKTSMLKSSLCDCSDGYILAYGAIIIAALAAGGGNNGKKLVFKNCAPFTDCISEISNKQIGNAKLYVPVITLSTQDSEKLLQQLKSGLKGTIIWNKYQSKTSMQARNQYLDYLIDPSF